MTTTGLLDALRARGIEVLAEGDRLHCRPKGALTPELREALAVNKRGILALLAAAARAEPEPTAQWREQAIEIVQGGEIALRTSWGASAREWLNARGLRDETLKAWRVGYIHDAQEWHPGLYVPRGVVVPTFVDGQLWQITMRRLSGEPTDTTVEGGHPFLFGADTLRGHRVAVLTTNEFDAMLLHQEAGDLVGVASLGGHGRELNDRAARSLSPVPRLLVAGDTGAEGPPGTTRHAALSRRVRTMPPPFGKDVAEFRQRGGQVREWVASQLEQIEARPLAPTGG